MPCSMVKWLTLAGKIDGAIAAAALALTSQSHDPQVLRYALLVSGLAGAVGAVLTVVSRFVGAKDSIVPGG